MDFPVNIMLIIGFFLTIVGFALVKKKTRKKIFWITGGNHAGFADYGKQKGDGKASINNEEQVKITVDAIITFIKNGKN